MLNIATPPPGAVSESCIELTAPVDVPVVAAAKSAEAASPKRISLPSIAPPASWGAVPGAGHLGPGEQRDRDDEEQRHHAADRDALAPVLDDEAEGPRPSRRG